MRNITDILGAPAGLGTGSVVDGTPGTGRSGPRGIESVIEYNGLYLNIREWIDTYLVTTIGGIDDADVRDSREVNPGYHGETAFEGFYGGRTLTLSGKVYTKTLFKLRDMQQALRQAFADLSQELPLIFRTPDPNLDLMLICKKSQPMQMADEQRTANHFERPFLITLRASNPRFLSVIRVRSYIAFTNVADFTSTIPPATVENFANPGVLTGYNERGGGFDISPNGMLMSKAIRRNLIWNPGIDFSNIDSSYNTTFWKTAGTGTGISMTTDEGGYGGSPLQLNATLATGQNAHVLSNSDQPNSPAPIAVISGMQYMAQAYFKANSAPAGAKAYFGIKWYSSNGTFISGTQTDVSAIFPPGPTWLLFTSTGVAPTGAVQAAFDYWIDTGVGTYSVDVDQPMIYQGSTGPIPYLDGDTPGGMWEGNPWRSPSRRIVTRSNICQNPSFEDTGSPNLSGATNLTAALDAGSGRQPGGTNNRSAKLTITANGNASVSLGAVATPPTYSQYAFSVYVRKASAAQANQVVRINVVGDVKSIDKQVDANLTDANWHRAAVLVTMNPTGSSVTMQVAINSAVSGHIFYLDNRMAEPAVSIGPYFDGYYPGYFWQGAADYYSAGPVGYVNLIKEPDFDDNPAVISADNSVLSVASTGGAGDNARYGVITTSFASAYASMWWMVSDITPGYQYSALGSVRSPFTSRQAELRVEWLDQNGAVIAFQRETVQTTGNWQEMRMTAAVPPDGAESSRWHLRFNGVQAGEVHHGDRMMVIEGPVLPSEGWFDGDSVIARWTGTPNHSSSLLPKYSILTTTRRFNQVSSMVKIITGSSLPSIKAGEIRLILAYIDDDNQMYGTIRSTGSTTTAQLKFYTVVGGIESELSSFADVIIDVNSTYWFSARYKNDYIIMSWFATDPTTNVAPVQTTSDVLTAAETALFKAATQIGIASLEEGMRYRIDEWSYKSEDDLTNWNVLVGQGVPYINNNRLYFYRNNYILMTRNDLGYKVGDCTLSMKLRFETGSGSQVIGVGYAFKVLDSANYLRATIQRNGTGGSMTMVRPDGTTLISGGTIASGDIPDNADRWLTLTVSGNSVTFGFWLTDPALGGSPKNTYTGTMTGADATKYGAGVKADVGIYCGMTGGANLFSIDDYSVQNSAFSDTAFRCYNEGNFRAQPQIFLTGPLTNLRLTNDANHEQIYIPATIPNGEQWCLDIQERRMYRVSDQANRFQYLDVNSDWMELEPGENPITAVASTMATASQIEFYFHHTVM